MILKCANYMSSQSKLLLISLKVIIIAILYHCCIYIVYILQDPNATTPAKDKKGRKKGKKDNEDDRGSPDGSKEESVQGMNGEVVLVPTQVNYTHIQTRTYKHTHEVVLVSTQVKYTHIQTHTCKHTHMK